MLNSLVDLAGQSPTMSNHVLEGFKGFSELLCSWLEEAEQKGMLREGLNLRGIANFMVISLNGAAPLYAASKDPMVWKQTITQLRFYLKSLRNKG